MIDHQKCLALIVGRGGSRELPGKNLAQLGGKTVLSWTIDAAKEARYLDRIVLSSDDPDIVSEARRLDCEVPFVRPQELATDTSPIAETIVHALNHLDEEFDYFVLLQATSPLRVAADIENCIELCEQSGAPAVISVTPASKPSQWLYRLGEADDMQSVVSSKTRAQQRQDVAGEVVINGAVYVARVDWYKEHLTFMCEATRAYMMPKERSVDIDDWIDLALARALVDKASEKNESSEKTV